MKPWFSRTVGVEAFRTALLVRREDCAERTLPGEVGERLRDHGYVAFRVARAAPVQEISLDDRRELSIRQRRYHIYMRDEDDVMALSWRCSGVQHGPPDLIRPDSRKHAMATEPVRKVGDCAVVLLYVRGDGRYPHKAEQHFEIEALLLRARHGGGDRAASFTGSAEG